MPLRFAGYAALFGTPDAARDTIEPGAFRRTLEEWRTGALGSMPLYWQHRPEQQIGWIEFAREVPHGLQVIGTVDNPDGRAASMLRAKAVSGLSIGYRTRLSRRTPRGRYLEDVDLVEVSLVAHPLQHGARVHFVSAQKPTTQTPSER